MDEALQWEQSSRMTLPIDFRVMELLCARLCHELVGPVAAINNGVELLGEDDPDFVKDAIALLGQSARKAAQRLQFYRFAYAGTGSGASADCRALVDGLLETGKVRCEWRLDPAALDGGLQKLGCNLLALAADALPRGGTVTIAGVDGAQGFSVVAEGAAGNFPEETRAALDPGAAVGNLSSRTVHAHFTALLARRLGAALTFRLEPARLVFLVTL